jgi:tRNA pseudouridine55 synthase
MVKQLMTIDFSTAAKLLKGADNVVILAHSKPDGDTLGSAFALLFALERMGKTARVQCADEIPGRYRFICPDYARKDFEPGFIAAVDVAEPKLLGKLADSYKDKIDLSVDHHISNTLYAAHTLLDATASAAGEVVLRLIDELGVEVNAAMADALFTAITTDTGGFCFANTTAETHRAAVRLIECGANHTDINRLLFDTKTRGRLKLDRLMLETMRFELEDLCAVIEIPHDIKEKYGIVEDDLDNISALPRMAEGVLAGVTIREMRNETTGKTYCRVSVRTNRPVDASVVCGALGGGGHANAAGVMIHSETAKARVKILEQIRRELVRHGLWAEHIGANGREIGPKGILIIDKPEDFTSFDVVAKLRGMLGTRQIGHTGTLDPMVTGVLPVLIGRAVKATDVLPDQRKRYTAKFRLGITTDTQDIGGEITERREVTSAPEEIHAAILAMRGESMQTPPMYSAVKVDGKRLYNLAREGVEVERKPRPVTIEEITIVNSDHERHEYVIDVLCSKGTYIRTLCYDIGEKLGCGAVMTELRRTMAAGFTLDGAITLEEAQRLTDADELRKRILPVDVLFADLPRIQLSDRRESLFLSGAPITEGSAEAGKAAVFGPQGFLGVADVSAGGQIGKRKLFVLKDSDGNA